MRLWRIVYNMKRSVFKINKKAQGRDTIDIIAKPGSEEFWEKQGFISVKPYLSEKFEDQRNQPMMGEKGYLPSKFQAMKLPDFRDAVIDKDGNITRQTSEQKTKTVKAKIGEDGKVTGEKEKQKTKKVKVKFDKEGNETPKKGKEKG